MIHHRRLQMVSIREIIDNAKVLEKFNEGEDDEIVIMSGIPLPASERGKKTGTSEKYPFSKMTDGNAFFIKVTPDTVKKVKSTLSSVVFQKNKKSDTLHYTCRVIDLGVEKSELRVGVWAHKKEIK